MSYEVYMFLSYVYINLPISLQIYDVISFVPIYLFLIVTLINLVKNSFHLMFCIHESNLTLNSNLHIA